MLYVLWHIFVNEMAGRGPLLLLRDEHVYDAAASAGPRGGCC